MVVVYLDAASSHRPYCRRSAVEFDLCAWSRVYAFVAKASQRNKPHLSRVACSESLVRRQFDRRPFSNVGSFHLIIQRPPKSAFSPYSDSTNIDRLLTKAIDVFPNHLLPQGGTYPTLVYSTG